MTIGIKNRAYGIDLSRWDPDFNPDLAVQGLIDLCILKATEGLYIKDTSFESLYLQSLRVKVNGAYHYLRSQYGGVSQARYFSDTIGIKKFNILAIDFERINNDVGESFVRVLYDCLMEITRLRPECRIVLYTGPDLYDTVIYPACMKIWGRDVFLNWDLWIAQYWNIENPDNDPGMPIHRKDWKLYQFSENGNPVEHGTTSFVDRNVFNGSLAELLAWAEMTSVPSGEIMETWKCKVSLNLRTAGNASASLILTMVAGDVIEGIFDTTTGWIHISKLNNVAKDGWCSGNTNYVEKVIVSPVPPATNTLPDINFTVEIKGYPLTTVLIKPLP